MRKLCSRFRRGRGTYNWMARHGPLNRTIRDLTFPNSTSFANLLQPCIDTKSVWDGRRIHACLIKSPFSSEIYVQNRLIDLYAKCGCLEDARKLFRRMHERNTFSWNALLHAECKLGSLEEAAWLFIEMPDPDQCSWNSMISGFSQRGCLQGAVTFFHQMHSENFVLNMYAFSSALSACAGLTDLNLGMQIHATIFKSPLATSVFMGTALLDMYSKCTHVSSAQKVFDEMIERNVVSWNSLITCYEQNGPPANAIDLFVVMMEFGLEPDEVTLASVVCACATVRALKEGLQIHAKVVKCD